MRRVFAMAAAAWSASERTSAISAASNARVRVENVPSAPNVSSAGRQRGDDHRADADLGDDAVRTGRVVERGSARSRG